MGERKKRIEELMSGIKIANVSTVGTGKRNRSSRMFGDNQRDLGSLGKAGEQAGLEAVGGYGA